MKKILNYVIIAFIAIIITGCASGSGQPLEPIGESFKFEKITLDFKQKHFPKTKTYQTKDDVERKLNEEIVKNLKEYNLINNTSSEELFILVNWQRIFMGEEMPFESMRSDKIGSPKLGYDLKIIKNGKVLRNISRKNLIFDAGFFNNLKHITMQDEADERENAAIKALSKDITDFIVENFK